MLRREQVSTPLVGSSRTTVLDMPRKAMPMDSLLRRPPERARACVCWSGVSPTSPRVLKREQGRAVPEPSEPHPERPRKDGGGGDPVSAAGAGPGAWRPLCASPEPATLTPQG